MGLLSSIEKVTEAKWYKVMMSQNYTDGEQQLVILGALFKIEHLPWSL